MIKPEAVGMFLFLIFLYVFLAFLTAFYAYEPKKRLYRKEFVAAIIALLLFPLVLNAIGNESLKEFAGADVYKLLEVMAYACVVALASRRVIQVGLESLKLNEVKDDIDELKKEQMEIIDKQAQVDSQHGDFDSGYDAFLIGLSKLAGDLKVSKENYNHLQEAERNKHLHVYGSIKEGSEVRIVITKLGKSYLGLKK